MKVLPKVFVGRKQHRPKDSKTNPGANATAEVGAVKAFPESPGTTKVNNCQANV